MIVKDLVESKQLLAGETEEHVYIVYERYENVDCQYRDKQFEELECDPEERIQILMGSSDSSLVVKETLEIGKDHPSLESALDFIKTSKPDLFN
ncbi:hypothetical protein FLK61_30255 [Paenalkalicoccus suaedae]|uniref:Uncharacterized protein n=1 Tax=Paenalkalicoccus suaedae TaxID=2592382 RepID=A0A859FE62_9BACI|nr:hypothetical protein [Paenalkalicoccus suaedae]QKS71002.1 hypothetical protein FLK61_30255 [Paenalkalicoccus suaedae]